MPSARIGTAVEHNIAMPIGSGKAKRIGTAVEHDTAMPMLAIGGAGAVFAIGFTTEEQLPDGTAFWQDDDRPHDLVGSGTEVLLFLVVVMHLGKLIAMRFIARQP